VGAVAVSLAAKHDATIVVDPSLSDRNLPRGFTPDAKLENALNLLSARVREMAWRRIRVSKNRSAQEAERICAEVRAAAATTIHPLAVESPKQRTLFITSIAAPADSDSKTMYVLYDRSLPSDGMTNQERFVEMQRDMTDLMSGLPPEERPNPMAAWGKVLLSNDKATIERVMTPMHIAGMKMWGQVPPAQRQEMMNDSMQVMNRYGSVASGAADSRKTRTITAPNYRPQLVEIAGRLGKRYDAIFLVEPSLVLGTLPQIPEDSDSIEAALNALIRPLRNVEWRRIYIPRNIEATRSYVNSLAADVRRIEAFGESGMAVNGKESEPAVSVDIISKKLVDKARLSSSGLDGKPVYLLYNRSSSGEADTQSRYERLLTNQMRSLLSMNSDQLGDAMDQAIQSYQSGEGARRSDVMGLPLMAAMMATWFPRAAKEQAGKPF